MVYRSNTFFHEKLMPINNEDPGSLVLKSTSLPEDELKALFRITRLTMVVLDKRVFTHAPIPGVTLVASQDLAEVNFTRRTLYE